MKKKTRIIGSISALAISMAMLAGGVLAASQVNLNVSSTVSFEAQGVYLKVQGQVKRGTESGTSNLNESERPEGDVGSYSYLDYSYTEEADGTPSGSSSFENMPEWKIGTVVFTESQNKIEYVMTFTNYSEKDIEITITPTVDESLMNITASSTEASSIALTPNQTQSYTFTLTLNDFSKSVSGAVSFNISAKQSGIVYAPIQSINNLPELNNMYGLSFEMSINETYYSRNGMNDEDFISSLPSLKEGDKIDISAFAERVEINLYNSEGGVVNTWDEIQELHFNVPELKEGYYFIINLTPQVGGGGSAS